jgi:hypothetical protein
VGDLLPGSVRRQVRARVNGFRLATRSLRLEPSFFLIGASRSGTTTLYDLLTRHPQARPAARKELEYFDLQYHARHAAWYRSNFALRPLRRAVTGEATPSYLLDPRVPARLAHRYPDAMLIVLLRDPVDRAYSHWAHEVALGVEPLGFEDAIAAEPDRTEGELERMLAEPSYISWQYFKYSYLARGLYADRLEPWLEHFPREQFLFLDFDHLASNQVEALRTVLDFLGLPAWEPRWIPVLNRGSYAPPDEQTVLSLRGYFSEPNERLERLLGVELGWERATSRSALVA